MKKRYYVFACMALWPAFVMAQSSVTVYGHIDVGYGASNDGMYEKFHGKQDSFQQVGSAYFTSYWGLKGSEDLGNGYAINFRLEHSFNPEDGTSNGNGFDRFAYVGVSAPWGTIRAGLQQPLIAPVIGIYDVTYAPNMSSALGNVGLSAYAQKYGNTFYSRVSSSLQYETPEMAGFRLYAEYASKNDEVGLNNQGHRAIYSLAASYRYGGFQAAIAYESKPTPSAGAAWGTGVQYDFGSFVLSGSYFDNHLREDGKGFSLGFRVPMQAWTFGAQIARNIDAPEGKPTAWEIFCYYNLSKRTMLYAQYGGINSSAKKFIEASRKSSITFGLSHHF